MLVCRQPVLLSECLPVKVSTFTLFLKQTTFWSLAERLKSNNKIQSIFAKSFMFAGNLNFDFLRTGLSTDI